MRGKGVMLGLPPVVFQERRLTSVTGLLLLFVQFLFCEGKLQAVGQADSLTIHPPTVPSADSAAHILICSLSVWTEG